MTPFFSIIIPTYNRAKHLPTTIRSTLSQTFERYEVIIVDDGSTDDTTQIIDKLFSGHQKVKYFRKENGERGAARNFGACKAQGEYLVFLDSDDYMHPDHLEVLYTEILASPDINFFATKFYLKRDGQVKTSPICNLPAKLYDYSFFLKGNPLACNLCVKKNNPKLVMFCEDREYAIMEDWMFLLKNLSGDHIQIIDNITITMNDHDGRSMRGDNFKIIHKRLLAVQWAIKELPLNGTERKIIFSFSYYFCAIHSYLDDNKKMALSFWSKSFSKQYKDPSAYLLLIKVIMGRKLIQVFARGIF